MVAPRRKHLAASRRRLDDEGEDEDDSITAGVEDDSMSEEGSALSDADDDADAEGSEVSGIDGSQPREIRAKISANGRSEAVPEQHKSPAIVSKQSSFATMTSDTAAMMNGLSLSTTAEDAEEINFDDIAKVTQSQPPASASAPSDKGSNPTHTLGDKRRQEHEEYKRKRDADPSFVPNRGGFFMHDHRSIAPGQNGFRPYGRGRGRGRGAIPPTGPSSQVLGPTEAPWAHDLHESVVQPEPESLNSHYPPSSMVPQNLPQPASIIAQSLPPNRSFSRTIRIGKVQIRIFLTGMVDPVTFSAVPVSQHTRLPHHRPPLRRDKPMRASLPDMPIRYIFPSTDRSFIFIPRALRPNQQGFGRARGRGSFSVGYGGLSSRRTSAYAGSAYSPSVALSRRSSLAREVSAEGLVSPIGITVPRAPNVSNEPGKPVVRLPPAVQQAQDLAQQEAEGAGTTPVVNLPQVPAYPLPEKPTYRENRPAPIPMHQPKPQKTVSVTDIESPATLVFNPPQQQDQQPFHQQVPIQVVGQAYQQDLSMYQHSRHPSHPSQASGGTPLSQIPERAIHAQPFQPYPYQQPQAFYPPQYQPTIYYYPTMEQMPATGPSIAAPTFVPSQQYAYHVPVAPAPPPPTESTAQAGTVAHESNGMVYYYDSSQLNTGGEGTSSFPPAPPAAYALPQTGGVVGIGGMMTPPIQYFPQPSPAVYYPPQ